MVFAIFYNAFDAPAGISTGILARAAGEDQLGDQAAIAAIVGFFFVVAAWNSRRDGSL